MEIRELNRKKKPFIFCYYTKLNAKRSKNLNTRGVKCPYMGGWEQASMHGNSHARLHRKIQISLPFADLPIYLCKNSYIFENHSQI